MLSANDKQFLEQDDACGAKEPCGGDRDPVAQCIPYDDGTSQRRKKYQKIEQATNCSSEHESREERDAKARVDSFGCFGEHSSIPCKVSGCYGSGRQFGFQSGT